MTNEDKKSLANRLETYRKEMNDFGLFLKDKFIKNGPGYVFKY
jgi:hypothetical protein